MLAQFVRFSVTYLGTQTYIKVLTTKGKYFLIGF